MRAVASVAVMTSLVAASACQTGPDALDRADPEQQTILLSVAVFDAMGVRPLIRTWERAHPGVSVQLQPGTWVEQNEDLLNGFGADTPDVVTVEGTYSERVFSRTDSFVDLGRYGAVAMSDEFFPWRWQQGVHQPSGRVFGIPTDVGGLALAYRTDLFEQAGLPTEPEQVAALLADWDSYLAVGKQFTATTGLAWLDHPSWLFSAISYQHPRQLAHTIADGRFMAGPGIRRAWSIAIETKDMSAEVELMDPGVFNPAITEFATAVAPAWMTTHIKETAPEAEGLWSIAPIPERRGNWGGSQLAIPLGSEHPDLAWDLISFLSTASSQLEILEQHGNFPSRLDVYEVDSVATMTDPFFNDAPVFEIYSESIASAAPLATTVLDRPIRVAFDKALNLMLDDDWTATDAWRFALTEIEKEIAAGVDD